MRKTILPAQTALIVLASISRALTFGQWRFGMDDKRRTRIVYHIKYSVVKSIAILFSLYLLFLYPCFGQKKRTQNWVLGDSLFIHFEDTGISMQKWPLHSLEGMAIFNDINGNARYSANGEFFLNAAKNSFATGGNQSTTQSSVFIEHPYDSNIVLLFTLDDRNSRGLTCYMLDNRLNSGNGGIVKSETGKTNLSEKMAVTGHENGIDYWLVVHAFDKPEYYSYKIDASLNLNQPITSQVLRTEPIVFAGSGQLKFSPSGKYAAAALNYNQGVDFFSFNKETGILKNLFTIPSSYNPYGVEFSPDETKLYISDEFDLYQFDLSLKNANDIINSKFKIGTSKLRLGSLQLGPDNKVYVAQGDNAYLGVINAPDSNESKSNYSTNGLFLSGRKSKYGLPNFPSTYFFDSTRVKSLDIKGTEPDEIHSFPNVFTPNGDNHNDCYFIDLAGHVETFNLTVLNTWGMKLFETNDVNFCWNGYDNINNRPQPVGVYYFRFEIVFLNGDTLVKDTPVLLLR